LAAALVAIAAVTAAVLAAAWHRISGA